MTSDPNPRPLVAPPWLDSIQDLGRTPAQILIAAAELFGERSPSAVSLRAIAERAGVNYGLIHHYFGTKEAVLAELLRRASAAGAAHMTDTETIGDSLAQLIQPISGRNYSHMLAWAMLGDADPQRLVSPSPAMAHLSAVVQRQWDASGSGGEVDPRIVTAMMVSAVLGWRFFRPFITVAAQLDDRSPEDLSADVMAVLTSAVRGLVGEGDPPS